MSKASRTIKHSDQIEKNQLDYIEELTASNAQDTSEAPEPDENTETEAQKYQSPLTGRMSGTMEELERVQSCEMMYSDEIRECLHASLDCYQTCTETTMKCLSMGGKHAEQGHINLLLDCTQICSANANFIIRNSPYYPQSCGICADICDECSDVCDRFEDDFMKECAGVCRRCAEACRELAR